MRRIGLGLLIIGSILYLGINVAETAIIIRMGIQFLSVLRVLSFCLFGAGIVVLCLDFIQNIKKRLSLHIEAKKEAKKEAEMRKEEARPTLSYAAKSYDPADIRRRLNKLSEQRPDLSALLKRCVDQMDTLDRRQAKLKDLLDLNEAEYLRATEDLLDEVEQFICKNFRKVINRGIVSDEEDKSVVTEGRGYSTDAALIEAVLVSNQEELDNIKKFLADLADLISEQNESSETTLEAWMKVIRDSLIKGEI